MLRKIRPTHIHAPPEIYEELEDEIASYLYKQRPLFTYYTTGIGKAATEAAV
jgi:hypothetical protein